MDLADLVHPAMSPRRILRLPAVHFALIGAALFGATRLAPPDAVSQENAPLERETLVVPSSRVAEARRDVQAKLGRALTVEEDAAVVRSLADEEILFRYAVELGLHRGEVPQRRLAQIASFVTDGDATAEPAQQARQAVELGLHQGDLVVRRILVDAARRLIRDAVLRQEPTEEALAAYLEANADDFRQPPKVRVSQVLMSHSRRPDATADARALLTRLQEDAVSPAEAAALSDPGFVPSTLPLLAERDVERRFGRAFTARLEALPVGEWSGPLRSRYGAHLVFVHQYVPGGAPELAAVKKDVRSRLRQDLANRWLEERLRQLREGYDISVGTRSAGEVTS